MAKVGGGGGSVSGSGKGSFGGGVGGAKCSTKTTDNNATKTTTVVKSCGIEGFKGKLGIDASKYNAAKLSDKLNSKVEAPKTPDVKKEPKLSSNLKLKSTEINLSPKTKEKMGKIADEYNRLTGKKVTITDTNRTPKDQAERVYDKIKKGEAGIYTQKNLLGEVKTAYKAGVAKRETPKQITDRMAKVIQDQVNKGQYISRHLIGEGVDVRSRDMSTKEKESFKEVVKNIGGASVLKEDDHFHIQID